MGEPRTTESLPLRHRDNDLLRLRGAATDPRETHEGRRAKWDPQLSGAAMWGLLWSEGREKSRETSEALHTLP